MRQEVNLYQAGLQPQKRPLSALRVLLVLCGVLCLLAGASLYTQYRAAELNQSLKQARSTRQPLQERVQELRQKVAQQKDRNLRRRIRELQTKRKARRQLLNVLSRSDASGQRGFAPFLKALARQHLPRLWLTDFSIDLEGTPSLRLSGRTTDSERIPGYLLRLSREQVFSGLNFRTLRAERLEKEPQILGFTLASEAE